MVNRDSIYRRIAFLLATTLLFAGCDKKEEAKAPPAPSAPAPTAQAPAPPPTPAPQASPTTPPGTTTPAPAPSASSAPVLATADGEWPGARVEVQELKRSSGTVLLRFTLSNDGNEKINVYGKLGGSVDNVAGISLVDTANKKKYLVVMDSANKCVCSDSLPSSDINPKSRLNLWAKFPAPPDDVKKISVIIPHFTPMDDVPISG